LRRHARVGDKIRETCPEAPRVISRLVRYGHETYLCGGCVRDLLLDQRPKDFDIATNATPRQVKRLFRNSRIIGRRFRLVQLNFPDKILEVSTFRAAIDPPADSPDLLILQDNTFGTAEEDARRRDFTINGLFYDLRDGTVIDFVGGLRDLDRRIVETIGDPWVRFREDPVRMLRAVKFASRLGFRLADDLYSAILDCREELQKAAPARVHEELIRLTNMGGAHDAVRLMYRTGLLATILPELSSALDAFGESAPDRAAYWAMLRSLDAATRRGDPPSNARLFSCLLWPLFLIELETGQPTVTSEEPEDGLAPIAQRLRMSRRDGFIVRQIVYAQARFVEPLAKPAAGGRRRRRRGGQNALAQRDWFHDAFFFFQARALALGRPELLADWEAKTAAERE
jgi:poly(A) polymerase